MNPSFREESEGLKKENLLHFSSFQRDTKRLYNQRKEQPPQKSHIWGSCFLTGVCAHSLSYRLLVQHPEYKIEKVISLKSQSELSCCAVCICTWPVIFECTFVPYLLIHSSPRIGPKCHTFKLLGPKVPLVDFSSVQVNQELPIYSNLG